MITVLAVSVMFGFGFVHGYSSTQPDQEIGWSIYLIAVVASLICIAVPAGILFRPSMNRLFSGTGANQLVETTETSSASH